MPNSRDVCRKSPGDTGLITCSLSANVGFLRAMSFESVVSRWFAAGSTRSLNQTIVTVRKPAAMIPGQHHLRLHMYIAQARGGRFEVVENLGAIDPQERQVEAPVLSS